MEKEGLAYFGQLISKLGILFRHVQRITTEDSKSTILEEMDLSPFSIILVLAGEFLALEAIQYFCNGLGRFGQHGLERDSRSEETGGFEVADTVL